MSTTINSIDINSISYQELITELHNTPVQHLEEVPFGDFELSIDLIHEAYNSAEATGYCRAYSARVKGNFAGYMLVMASEMLHHRGTVQAVTDSFYIHPVYRTSGVFKALLEHVEADLKSNGIRFLTVGLNPNMPHVDKVKNFVHDLGYMHTEYLITKEL